MGLLSFIQDAGEKLFGTGHAKAASPADANAANSAAAKAIEAYIRAMDLDAENLAVAYDGASATATVSGVAADQQSREKIVLCCGNVDGVSKVDDRLTVAAPAADEARYYTVVRGDTLSKIAKEFYGNPGKYPVIFEANKPMLKHPDKIYPGQMLRIPPQA